MEVHEDGSSKVEVLKCTDVSKEKSGSGRRRSRGRIILGTGWGQLSSSPDPFKSDPSLLRRIRFFG